MITLCSFSFFFSAAAKSFSFINFSSSSSASAFKSRSFANREALLKPNSAVVASVFLHISRIPLFVACIARASFVRAKSVSASAF